MGSDGESIRMGRGFDDGGRPGDATGACASGLLVRGDDEGEWDGSGEAELVVRSGEEEDDRLDGRMPRGRLDVSGSYGVIVNLELASSLFLGGECCGSLYSL